MESCACNAEVAPRTTPGKIPRFALCVCGDANLHVSRPLQIHTTCIHALVLRLNFSEAGKEARHKAGNTQLMFFLKFGGSFALPLPR